MLDLKIDKHAVFVDKIENVRQRIFHLSQWSPSPSLVLYKEIKVLPRHIIISADNLFNNNNNNNIKPLQYPIKEEEARIVMQGLLRALFALHSRQIVHGHISVENLYINQSSNTILLSEHILPIDLFVPSSNIGYKIWSCCAPEIKRNSTFDYSADIWSVGAVFLQLLAPKEKLYETEDLQEIDVLSPELMSLTPSAISFALQCLQEEAENRPTIADLIVHPFLTDKYEWSENSGTDSEATEGEI